MKANLLQQREYYSFDTYYTNNAINLIKGPKRYSSKNIEYQRICNIALGAVQLLPAIFLDFAIRTPVNLIFRNASISVLNNLDNKYKAQQPKSFFDKHKIILISGIYILCICCVLDNAKTLSTYKTINERLRFELEELGISFSWSEMRNERLRIQLEDLRSSCSSRETITNSVRKKIVELGTCFELFRDKNNFVRRFINANCPGFPLLGTFCNVKGAEAYCTKYALDLINHKFI